MVDLLEGHQIPCVYKYFFGIECPTCGFQRALIYLLKGDLISSLKTYPALIPTLLIILLLITRLITNKPAWKLLKYFLFFDLALIFISYGLRLIG